MVIVSYHKNKGNMQKNIHGGKEISYCVVNLHSKHSAKQMSRLSQSKAPPFQMITILNE